jgi:hypothetical protein
VELTARLQIIELIAWKPMEQALSAGCAASARGCDGCLMKSMAVGASGLACYDDA